MPRYFVALPLPDAVKDLLLALQPPAAPGTRLSARGDLHLTLHFVGEVAAEREAAIRNALAGVREKAFTLGLRGVGMFPPGGPARALWAGVEAHPSLTMLHSAVAAALTAAVGFQPERRPYTPHVTLAYLNTPAPPEVVDRFLAGGAAFQVPSVPVHRFTLYTSSMAEDRSRYHEEAAFDLFNAGP